MDVVERCFKAGVPLRSTEERLQPAELLCLIWTSTGTPINYSMWERCLSIHRGGLVDIFFRVKRLSQILYRYSPVGQLDDQVCICRAKVQFFEGGKAFHTKWSPFLIYKWWNHKLCLKGFHLFLKVIRPAVAHTLPHSHTEETWAVSSIINRFEKLTIYRHLNSPHSPLLQIRHHRIIIHS